MARRGILGRDPRPPYRTPDPHPSGARPPKTPRRAGAQARRHRHGRQRPLGQGARPAAHRGPQGRRGRRPRRAQGLPGDRRQEPLALRLLHRELEALARGGALPDELQPRRHPPPPRRDGRAGHPHPLGRPDAEDVEVGRPGAPGRPGADRRQRRDDAVLLRQLRRARGDRRRGAGHRPRCRGGQAGPVEGQREDLREVPLLPGHAGRRPLPAARAASSARPTTCSGRAATPRWSSRTSCGRTSTAATCGGPASNSPSRDRRFGGAIPNEDDDA